MKRILPEGRWRFVAYQHDGDLVPVSEAAPAELIVEDGRISGTAGVNRLIGNATELPLDPVGMTMMAGPQELMDQEHRIVTLLGEVDQVIGGLSGMFLLSNGLELLELVCEGTDPHEPLV